jgi:hypothetical protein
MIARRKFVVLMLKYGGRHPEGNPTTAVSKRRHRRSRRNSDQARIVETTGDELDDKTGRRLGPGIGRTPQDGRAVSWLSHMPAAFPLE